MSGTENKIEPVKLYSITSTPENCDETLPPIIFIPGFFSTNRTFTYVRYKISTITKRKIYVIELRNHGLSDYSEDFSLLHCIADFENFLETDNITRAVLAGHSMGGKLALAMALKHPDRFEKVIVEDVSVVNSKSAIEGYLKNLVAMRFIDRKFQQLPSDISESEAQNAIFPFFAKFFSQEVQKFSKGKSQVRLPLHKNASGKVEWEFNSDVLLGRHNILDKFDIDLSSNPVFTGETLLLVGEHSFLNLQDDMDIFCKHFPNLTCKTVPNAFHTYHVECAELYVKLVSKFIGEDDTMNGGRAETL